MPYSPVISIGNPIVDCIVSTPTITTAGFTISPALTYAQILQSLGVNVYGSEFFYLYANSTTQISQPVTYNHFDSNGNAITTILVLHVDPYQSQNSIYYETNPEEVVFDGFSSLAIDILPQSTVMMKFFVLVTSNSLYLNELHKDSFQEIEEMEGVKFFDDFCNYLIDNQDGSQKA